jgi:hypothetical protein
LDRFQGMPYWLAASVLYGDHRAATAKPFDKPEEIKTLARAASCATPWWSRW